MCRWQLAGQGLEPVWRDTRPRRKRPFCILHSRVRCLVQYSQGPAWDAGQYQSRTFIQACVPPSPVCNGTDPRRIVGVRPPGTHSQAHPGSFPGPSSLSLQQLLLTLVAIVLARQTATVLLSLNEISPLHCAGLWCCGRDGF